MACSSSLNSNQAPCAKCAFLARTCYKQLLLQDRGSDVTFMVGNLENQPANSVAKIQLRRIPAHKFILATTSPVFEAMFWSERAQNDINPCVVNVIDIEPEAFVAILK